jgi:hypothetical protein
MATGFPTGWISTVSEFIQLNTTARAGAVILPSTFLAPGRMLTFKDTQGTFSRNPVTFSTINTPQVFENNTTRQVRNDTLGAYTFTAGDNNTWYITGGSFMPIGIISSLTSINTSSITVSTANTTLSSVKFTDRLFGGTQDLYMRSTLLMFGSTNIPWAGTRVGGPRFQITPARLFSPRQIATLSLWLDASDPNTYRLGNSSSILYVNDKSGNNYNLSNSFGFSIANNFNGKYANFNSPTPANGYLIGSNTSFTLTGTFTSFAVGLISNSAGVGRGYLYDGANGTNRVAILDGGTMYTSVGLGYFTGTVNTAPLKSPFVGTWVMNGASSYVNTNGTLNGTVGTLTNGTFGGIIVGNRYSIDSGNQWTPNLSELLIYNSALTAAQIQQIEGYLAWKWGLVGQLPTSHAFKYRPP